MKILVRRTGALGDVVLATPVVRRLRREHPEADIFVRAAYPDVFKDSPHRLTLNASVRLEARFDLTVVLDLAYERRPGMHVVEAYMEEAFGVADAKAPAMRQELFFDRRPLFAPDPRRPFVAVHAAGGGWRNRTLPRATWEKTIDGLYRAGMR